MTSCDGRAKVRIAFNQGRPPELNDVFAAVEKVLGQGPCTRCGLDGIDFLLRLEEIVEPQPLPWVATQLGGEGLAG
jgi:hypothetical protein